jgi:hypothetical protein
MIKSDSRQLSYRISNKDQKILTGTCRATMLFYKTLEFKNTLNTRLDLNTIKRYKIEVGHFTE